MIRDIRGRFGTNTLIGVLLLIALFSLAGDEAIQLVAQQVPGVGISEAPPCRWLPAPQDLANHQSLIARAAIERGDALGLEVRSSAIPTSAEGILVIRILVINETLGTVPFIYNPDAVIVGDNNTSGLGIFFSPASNIFLPGVNLRQEAATYSNDNIRILGPQQRCVHSLEFSADQIDNNLRSGNATVQAYYRGVNSGTVPQANPTPVYTDQGLPTGVVFSNPAPVPIAGG